MTNIMIKSSQHGYYQHKVISTRKSSHQDCIRITTPTQCHNNNSCARVHNITSHNTLLTTSSQAYKCNAYVSPINPHNQVNKKDYKQCQNLIYLHIMHVLHHIYQFRPIAYLSKKLISYRIINM